VSSKSATGLRLREPDGAFDSADNDPAENDSAETADLDLDLRRAAGVATR
jgi:hypothetical protein